MARGVPGQSLGLVFPSRTGKVLKHGGVLAQTLHPVLREAKLFNDKDQPKYGLHALRHFYASWCINRRADGGLELPAKTVQARLGHASIVMTLDRYGHLFPSGDDGSELAEAERRLLPERHRRDIRTCVARKSQRPEWFM